MNRQQAIENMRRDIYRAIRQNRSYLFNTLSRHEIVHLLATIMSDQLTLIRQNAQNQRTD